jgi:hypothetical protein
MTKKSSFRKTAVVIGTLLAFLSIELSPEVPFVHLSFASEAQARIDRPRAFSAMTLLATLAGAPVANTAEAWSKDT